jgi:hypothetical protein
VPAIDQNEVGTEASYAGALTDVKDDYGNPIGYTDLATAQGTGGQRVRNTSDWDWTWSSASTVTSFSASLLASMTAGEYHCAPASALMLLSWYKASGGLPNLGSTYNPGANGPMLGTLARDMDTNDINGLVDANDGTLTLGTSMVNSNLPAVEDVPPGNAGLANALAYYLKNSTNHTDYTTRQRVRHRRAYVWSSAQDAYVISRSQWIEMIQSYIVSINNNRPVILGVPGHAVVGVGYDSSEDPTTSRFFIVNDPGPGTSYQRLNARFNGIVTAYRQFIPKGDMDDPLPLDLGYTVEETVELVPVSTTPASSSVTLTVSVLVALALLAGARHKTRVFS